MTKKQNKPTKPVPPFNGHIIYPYNAETAEIFLRESSDAQYGTYLNGKRIAHQQMSEKFREALQTMGFEIKKEPVTHTLSRKRVFGVRIDVNKVMDGKKIKELFVRIPAYSLDELSKNKQTILKHVKTVAIGGDVTNKVNRC